MKKKNHSKGTTSIWRMTFAAVITFLLFSSVSHAAETNATTYPSKPTLKGELIVNEIHLEWTRNYSGHFKRYHILRTNLDTLPTYPEQKPIFSTTDRNENTYSEVISLNEKMNYYYRVCSVNTDNKISCSNIIQVRPNRVITSYDFFDDVQRDSWYEPYIMQLFRRGITSNLQKHFNPTFNVTRSELARWIITTLIQRGGYVLENAPTHFCDVGRFHPDAVYINQAYALGIAEGEDNGACGANTTFYPNRPVSRAEAIKMILLAFDYSPDQNVIGDDTYKYQNTDLFLDVHQNYLASSYISRAKAEGIVTGYPDDTFRPENDVNHAEMAKILAATFRFDSETNKME
ncbi:hypothetical protein COY07_05925 [Candidatus Peregrinibacteria bacterium CG_4_10_14_0_2_um_filter_43_11]|nr:MAG: hypothetical protein COY07_05925 [Candidatus Peregrinibacteria bacterium CG_4_10_14_0_2_um_filter_43_11]